MGIKTNTVSISHGAMFIDLWPLHRDLNNGAIPQEDLTMHNLRRLSNFAEESFGTVVTLARAYVPFENNFSLRFIEELAHEGIAPVRARAGTSGHVAKLMLAMDVMEILISKSEIKNIIIVAGDTSYIPLIMKIQEKDVKQVLVAYPKDATSGDLITIIGYESYVDLMSLLTLKEKDIKGHCQGID